MVRRLGREVRRWPWIVLLLLPVLAATAFGRNGLLRIARLYAEREELRVENAALARRHRALDRQIELLTHDPVTMEALARRDLGLVRPGDQVFVVEPRRPAAQQSP